MQYALRQDLVKVTEVFLSHGDLRLGVLPECGGSITHFMLNKTGSTIDLLRPASDRAKQALDPLGMACFPLFPFSNRIVGGRFSYDGKDYVMPANMPPEPHAIHGNAWYLPWQILQQESNRLSIGLTCHDANYPFQYYAEQEFILSDHSVDVRMSIKNMGSDIMPFGFGLHPYFPITSLCTIQAKNPQVWLNNKDMSPQSHVPTPAQWDMQNGLSVACSTMDNCFTGGDGKIQIAYPEHGIKLIYSADAPMHNLVVYIPEHREFFCAELVSNANGGFNRLDNPHESDSIIWLQPGESIKSRQGFSVELI